MTTTDYIMRTYSDEALQQKIAEAEEQGRESGYSRAAKHLLALLDTPERRYRAVGIATTGINLGRYGIYSRAVESASKELLKMIAAGEENTEHITERSARAFREQEQLKNNLNLEYLVAYVKKTRADNEARRAKENASTS